MPTEMNDAAIVRAGGACALLGVLAGFAGAAVGAVHGLGGQEIPLATGPDFLLLVQKQSGYLVRESLFLAYAVFVVGEGVGLYYLTRPARSVALWGLVAWSAGILTGIVQDRFARVGLGAAVAGGFYGIVTAAAPHFSGVQALAERAFGLVVLWDLWAAIVMLRFREGSQVEAMAQEKRAT
jgi:hypothetical protein